MSSNLRPKKSLRSGQPSKSKATIHPRSLRSVRRTSSPSTRVATHSTSNTTVCIYNGSLVITEEYHEVLASINEEKTDCGDDREKNDISSLILSSSDEDNDSAILEKFPLVQ